MKYRRFQKISSKYQLLKSITLPATVLFALIFFFGGCEIKELNAPTWDVELNAPVFNRAYDVKTIIDKDTTVLKYYKDPTNLGLLYYADKKGINPIRVEDKLTFTDVNTGASSVVGQIKINDPQPVSAALEVDSWSGITPGQTVVFPAVTPRPAGKNFDVVQQFESATFDQGTLKLTFTNNNGPIQITLANIIIRDINDNPILFDLNSYTMNQGESREIPFNLAGKTLPNRLSVQSQFSTPGSGGNPVTIPAGAATNFSAAFENLVIAEATAVLPAQNPFSLDSTFVLDDSTYLQSVVFNTGILNMNLTNNLDVEIDINLTLPELKNPSNQAFTQNFTLSRKNTTGATKLVTVDPMTDWSISSATLTNKLSYNVVATAKPTTDVRTINKNDSLSVAITLTNSTLKSFTGKLKPTELDIAESAIDLNLSDLSTKFTVSQINFDNPQIDLVLGSSSSIQLGFSGVIRGTNGIQTRTINIPYSVLSSGSSTVSLSPTELKNFFNGFSSKLPDSLYIVGHAIVNPNYGTGTIANTDSIYGDSEIEIPLKVGISGGVFRDSSDFSFSDENKENIDQLLNAAVGLKLQNGLPVQIQFSGRIYDENQNFLMYFPPQRPAQDTLITIAGGVIDVNGKVTSPTSDSILVQINSDEFDNLSKAKYIITTIKMNTSGGGVQPAQFRTSDLISIRGFGQVKYKVKLDKE